MRKVSAACILLTIIISLSLASIGCQSKKVDIRGPYEKKMQEHLQKAYGEYQKNDYLSTLASLDLAADQGTQYNRLDLDSEEGNVPISLLEVYTLRTMALHSLQDDNALAALESDLRNTGEPVPVVLKIFLLHHQLWYGDIFHTYENLKKIEAGVSRESVARPLLHYVLGWTEFFLGRWDDAKKDFVMARALANTQPKLYTDHLKSRIELANNLIKDHNPAITCLSLCRQKNLCKQSNSDCPQYCSDNLATFQYLRKRTLRMLLICTERGCTDIDGCINDQLTMVYNEINDRELDVLEGICIDLCEENLRCTLIQPEMGLCKDFCVKNWSPLGGAGINELKQCFAKKQCKVARDCYQRLMKMPIHPQNVN